MLLAMNVIPSFIWMMITCSPDPIIFDTHTDHASNHHHLPIGREYVPKDENERQNEEKPSPIQPENVSHAHTSLKTPLYRS